MYVYLCVSVSVYTHLCAGVHRGQKIAWNAP